MKKITQLVVVGSAMVIMGHATGSDENQLALQTAQSLEFARYSSDPLAITTRPEWSTGISGNPSVNRSFEQRYNSSSFSVSNNVRFSLSSAYAQAVPTAKVGRIGLGFAFVSGDGSEVDYSGGPVFTGYTSALGGAWLLDYSFKENHRLALIHTYYDYLENGVSIDSGSSTGLYLGIDF